MLSLITVFTLMMLPAITILAFSLLVSAFERKPSNVSKDNVHQLESTHFPSNLIIEL
ncbi:MAG: hypothetical protein KC484_07265 [Colwelliaceae bacterium]|jgi:hypothetical protein|nr:hypothetical protein [Colwelliaceae bacterium]